MWDESKIPVVEKGLDKIQHPEFKNELYVPSPIAKIIVADEEEEVVENVVVIYVVERFSQMTKE